MRNSIDVMTDRRPQSLGEVRLQADMLRGQVLATFVRHCRDVLRGRTGYRRAM